MGAPKNTQQFESVVVQVHSELYPRVHRRQQQPPQRSSSPASRATNLPTCSDDLLIRIRKSTCEVRHPCSKLLSDLLIHRGNHHEHSVFEAVELVIAVAVVVVD